MNDLYEKLASIETFENIHPIFTGVVDGKRVRVADVIDGVIYLTDEGKQFLEAAEPKSEDVEAPVKSKGKRSKKVEDVEVENPIEPIDDIDLSDLEA